MAKKCSLHGPSIICLGKWRWKIKPVMLKRTINIPRAGTWTLAYRFSFPVCEPCTSGTVMLELTAGWETFISYQTLPTYTPALNTNDGWTQHKPWIFDTSFLCTEHACVPSLRLSIWDQRQEEQVSCYLYPTRWQAHGRHSKSVCCPKLVHSGKPVS